MEFPSGLLMDVQVEGWDVTVEIYSTAPDDFKVVKLDGLGQAAYPLSMESISKEVVKGLERAGHLPHPIHTPAWWAKRNTLGGVLKCLL